MRRYITRRATTALRAIKSNYIPVSVAAVLCAFMLFAVIRIPEGAAPAELDAAASATHLQAFVDNPLNAPYRLVASGLSFISSSVLALRALSIFIFCVVVLALYHVLRHWHTKTVAALATTAFATNSIALTVGRLGTPLVMAFGWFVFTALLLWQVHGRSNKLIPALTILTAAVLLYTPGALWFFLLFGLFYRSRFSTAFRGVKTSGVIVASVLSLLLLAPLVISFVRDINIISQWLLLPDTFSPSFIATSVLQAPSAFVYEMPFAPLVTIANLPVFDLASGILFIIGINAYRKKTQLDRTRLMIAVFLVGIILGALEQTVTATVILLPFVFSIVAAGIEFLLDEWYSVFPKNPFARSFGLIAVVSVVLFSSYYQLTRFFVVWPQTPETRELYSESRIIE